MSRLFYAGLPAPGHVNPTLPVVAELVRRGHHVVYYDSEEFRAPIAASGAEFRAYPVAMPGSAEIGRLLEADDLTGVAVGLLQRTPDLLDFLLREIATGRPEAVLFDSNALWGEMAARKEGLPAVGFVISLVPEPAGAIALPQRLRLLARGLRALPAFAGARRRLVKRHGPGILPPRGMFPALGDLNILFSSSAMQPPTPAVDESFRLVGTSIDPSRAAEELPFGVRPPLVYVAVGTLMAGARLVDRCAEALSDHRGTVLVSTGRSGGAARRELPQAFVVRPHVPQLAVLQRAAVFVTHGGMNSVHEALYYGVPMVVVAHNAEWAYIGRRVEACGAGLLLGGDPPYGRVTAGVLRDAVHRVLEDESFRRRAGDVGRSLREAGGYARATDEVERLLASRS